MILIVPFIIAVLYPLLLDQIYTGRHLFGSSYIGKQFVFLLGFIPYIIYWKATRKRQVSICRIPQAFSTITFHKHAD
jgi:hypothetical protein